MINEITLQVNDGTKLYIKEWEVQQPKALICIIHGFGEHINRYNHIAEFFNQHSYAVAGMDTRGHGNSEGRRGHTPSYETYLDDIQTFTETAHKSYPTAPLILWGHSMGGNLVLNYLIKRQPNVKCVVATSPWIRLAFQPKPMLLFLGKMMRNIAPTFTQSTKLNPSHISKDPAVVQAYIKDPLVHDKMSASASMGVLDAAAWLNQYSGKINVPLLIMHGDADKLIDPAASKEFADRLTGNVTHKMWKDLHHETHNDPEQKEVLNYALQWIQSKL